MGEKKAEDMFKSLESAGLTESLEGVKQALEKTIEELGQAENLDEKSKQFKIEATLFLKKSEMLQEHLESKI